MYKEECQAQTHMISTDFYICNHESDLFVYQDICMSYRLIRQIRVITKLPTYTEIRDNHCSFGLAILPCIYVEIRDNHTCLGSAILHCQYAEISIKYMGLGAAIPHCQYAEIFAKPHAFESSHSVLSIFRNLYSL
jgi:hypothetical protein